LTDRVTVPASSATVVAGALAISKPASAKKYPAARAVGLQYVQLYHRPFSPSQE
jgi:hypothetical protein